MKNPVMFVHKVQGYDYDSGTFKVGGKVKAVYDTNGMGDLIPVNFIQTDSTTVSVTYVPVGQLYYRYKRNQK